MMKKFSEKYMMKKANNDIYNFVYQTLNTRFGGRIKNSQDAYDCVDFFYDYYDLDRPNASSEMYGSIVENMRVSIDAVAMSLSKTISKYL